MSNFDNMNATFVSHREVYNNDHDRTMIINMFLSIGTNMILRGNVVASTYLAEIIVFLEHCDGLIDLNTAFNCRNAAIKRRSLRMESSCLRRDALKFFSKRNKCTCLKKQHAEARRTIPKMGFCWGCDTEMERVQLSVCSRCMISQYCSRECQIEDLSRHRRGCDMFFDAQKQYVMSKRNNSTG